MENHQSKTFGWVENKAHKLRSSGKRQYHCISSDLVRRIKDFIKWRDAVPERTNYFCELNCCFFDETDRKMTIRQMYQAITGKTLSDNLSARARGLIDSEHWKLWQEEVESLISNHNEFYDVIQRVVDILVVIKTGVDAEEVNNQINIRVKDEWLPRVRSILSKVTGKSWA